jgi:hypothetical protein
MSVEVTPGPRAVLVRDSKDAGLGPILALDQAAWRALLDAAVQRCPTATAGLRVTREPRRTRHAGSEVATTWHARTAGIELHYTHDEWVSFAAGVREGDFEFAPVP